MGLTQQIVLAVMLDNYPTFGTEQHPAANFAIRGDRVRGIVFCFFSCGSVIHSRHSTKNKNKSNNDNYYQ